MATSIRSSSQNSAASGTAVSVSTPSGTTAGDCVICLVHGNGQITIADNNGGTPFTKSSITGDDGAGNYKPNPTNGQTGAIFYRYIVGGDPSTYNFTLSAGGRWGIVAIAVQNPVLVSPFDVTPTSGSNQDSAFIFGAANTITTNTSSAIDVPALFLDTGTLESVTTPGGYATVQAISATGVEQIVVVQATLTSAGATGSRSFSWGTSCAYFCISFAIKNLAVTASASTLSLMGVG